MSEDEAFITEASEQFGNRGAKQAQQILEQAAAMFAGGSLTDEDKIAFEEIEDMVQNEARLIICRWRFRAISWRNKVNKDPVLYIIV